MSALPPIHCEWNGEAFVPLARFSPLLDDALVIGERYPLVMEQGRSKRSHAHYFACISEAWSSLPEMVAERFPTPEALRKYALIKAGYRDERSIVCASKAEAGRVAAFCRPMDDMAIVIASDAVVTIYTAKSQSTKAMGRKVFQDSKDAVLRVLSEMIGVVPAALTKHAEAA